MIIASIALIYTIWLLYADNLKYILLNLILFAAGLVFYGWNKKEQGEKLFSKWYETLIAVIIVLGALLSIYLLATGKISATS